MGQLITLNAASMTEHAREYVEPSGWDGLYLLSMTGDLPEPDPEVELSRIIHLHGFIPQLWATSHVRHEFFSVLQGDSFTIIIDVWDHKYRPVDLTTMDQLQWTLYDGATAILSKNLQEGLTPLGNRITIPVSRAESEALSGYYSHEFYVTAGDQLYTLFCGQGYFTPVRRSFSTEEV